MLFLLFVGGCIAVVAVVGNEVNDAVNDDTLGGPNNPLTITEGEAFEVHGFEYADGWSIVGEPVEPDLAHREPQGHQRPRQGRPAAGRQIKLLNGSEVVATSTCTVGDGLDKIPEDVTVTVTCSRPTRCRRPTTRSRSRTPSRRPSPGSADPAGRAG